jgi:ubiquinone/menaquinone biosynthesis C-methylase UbiE
MKLNWFGRVAMNSLARATAQRRYTAQRMMRLGGDLRGEHALEVGCGRGIGVEIILGHFGATRVEAFDLDPKQVRLAEGRFTRVGADRVSVFVANATSIPAPDSSFDAVFDFGTIHQVVEWRQAVAEVARVLKPGGRYFFEAITHPLLRQSMRIAMESGADVTRIGLDKATLFEELTTCGIQLGNNYFEPRSLLTPWVVGDTIGVGLRASSITPGSQTVDKRCRDRSGR